MKMELGLPRLQKHVHQRPKLLLMYLHMTTKILKVQDCIKESSKKKQPQDGTKVPGMKVDLMVISIFVLTLVIRLWVADSTEEKGMDGPMTQLDVGHVTKLDILLPTVTH